MAHGGSSLYALDEGALAAARPDLILTQELCRVCAVSYREVGDAARAIDADITVVLYNNRKVMSNHAFKKGELNDAAISKILAEVPKILPEPK